ncbi:proto-oncogene tyrosine-protein kinase ROS [Latimeria chalumnae]|uniref:proto-oncogene tyrosine-protein kinase ROS n=1 Tax=Latimeria chalumnae TaxID=7897 RepID=UPI00313DD7EF
MNRIELQHKEFEKDRDFLTTPSKPHATYIGSHNVTLKWKAANVSEVKYIIQWKFTSLAGDWRYTESVLEPFYTVNDLYPYTEYLFRVVWIITSQLQLYSPPSLSYKTHALGVPSTPAIILRLESPTPDTVEVSWSPPLFPNGRIIGYNLKLSSASQELHQSAESHISQALFYSTKPNTTYRFAIIAVNMEGEGPAAEANITTPAVTDLKADQWLILSRKNSLKKRFISTLEEADCLPSDMIHHNITGITVNIRTQHVYFSEGHQIWMKGASNMSDTSDLKLFYKGSGKIMALSLDWLHQKMYFVMSEKLLSCNLEPCTVVEDLTPSVTSIKRIVADPHNGFIYLLLGDGIYKMNLPGLLGPNTNVPLVVRSHSLHDFVVNFQSKRLVFFNDTDKSFSSVFLDGSAFHTLRPPVRSFSQVVSLAYANNVFMATNDFMVFQEVHVQEVSTFSDFIVGCDLSVLEYGGFDNLQYYSNSIQPYPRPTQPQHIMLLFGSDTTVVKWEKPEPTVGTSPTAWQNWTYDVKVSVAHVPKEWVFHNVSDTSYTVRKLNSSTVYRVTVRAVSPGGKSPWADPFTGSTLKQVEEDPYILATGKGLFKQQLESYGPGELVLKNINNVSDIDWYNNTLYWSNSSGHVHVLSLNNSAEGFVNIHLDTIRNAVALAFDWLGHKIYWAGTPAKWIYRHSISPRKAKAVIQVKYPVKDFAVDSVNAYLYVATSYSVESARLNGKEHRIFQELSLLSDKQVFGLTLDLSYGFVYWLVRDTTCLHLYSTSLRTESPTDATVTEFSSWSSTRASQSAVVYYSSRLFWISNNGLLTVQEVTQNKSVQLPNSKEYTSFTIIQRSLKPLPERFSSAPNVIPELIPEASIKIEGNASNLTVVWNASSTVEYGTVFYHVSSKFLESQKDLTVSVYPLEGLDPYMEFDFSITPYTYWGEGSTTSTVLHTPEGVPSAPTNPRLFVTNSEIWGDTEKIVVEFRWNTPLKKNGELVKFTVYYIAVNSSGTGAILKDWNSRDVLPSTTSYKLENVTTGLTVLFQVQAFTSVGPGLMSDQAEANTSDLVPVPRIVLISGSTVMVVDMDNNETVQEVSAGGSVTAVSYIAQSGMLYYLREDSLYAVNIHNRSSVQLLQDSRLRNTTAMTVDWIGRHLFMAPRILMRATQVFVVDLERKVIGLEVIHLTQNSQHVTTVSLSVYPLLSRLYVTQTSDGGTRMLFYDLVNKTAHYMFESQHEDSDALAKKNGCNCSVSGSELGGALAIDTSVPDSVKIYFIKGMAEIWITDLEGCWCRSVIHVSLSAAPYMETPSVFKTANTSISLSLPPSKTQSVCLGILKPTFTYLVHYAKKESGNNCTSGLQCTVEEFQENIVRLQSLQPYTTYVIRAAVKSYYGGFPEQLGSEAAATTDILLPVLVPEPVGKVTVSVVSDSVVNISWSEPSQPNAPVEKVRYQVKVSFFDVFPATPLLKSQFPEGRLALSITGLQAETPYNFRVLVFHPEEDWFTVSTSVSATTFITPLAPFSIIPGNTSVQLEWENSIQDKLKQFWFELRELEAKSDWFQPEKMTCENSSSYVCNLTSLHPNRKYSVRVAVTYKTEAESASSPQTFKTTAGIPGRPGSPRLSEDKEKIIRWDKAEDNGCNVTYYTLEASDMLINDTVPVLFWHPLYREMKSVRSPLRNLSEPGQWKPVYNGSCSKSFCTWKVSDLKEGTFQFKVAAANSIGLGEYSDVSDEIVLNGKCWLMCCVNCRGSISLLLVWYKKSMQKKDRQNRLTVFFKQDLELAEIRGLGTGVGLSNACYAVSRLPTQSEMNSLPTFPRDKLTLLFFLGSGAFGEVYEGTAVDILGQGRGKTKVAVKTLKKGATDHEKAEFLKEAHLMSQFDHPHILKLLGVCLLNEPQYIILELMEGGDLLSYLRGARATVIRGPLLSVEDLLDICLDVSKGCTYLEKMHFVHRDLAARNCLVSVKEYDSPSRTVKIGDFGLARDVYKNDYYRKKGEGLLPVRWMAFESLIDGVFTNQSDVWSFGVLLWEIITMGQQPYPAYSNIEVLHFVRSGGRLDAPHSCPNDVYELMLRCWNREPNKRPGFCYIQDRLKQLKNSPLGCTCSYGESVPSNGVVNQAFEDGDILHENRGDDLLTDLTRRNNEGLNYLIFPINQNPGEGSSAEPVDAENSQSVSEKQLGPHVQQDLKQKNECKNCSEGAASPAAGTQASSALNYACIILADEGDSVSLSRSSFRSSNKSSSSISFNELLTENINKPLEKDLPT